MNLPDPIDQLQPQPAGSMAVVFFFIALGAIAVGGLPYLYPTPST